jgi:hypothetical protein
MLLRLISLLEQPYHTDDRKDNQRDAQQHDDDRHDGMPTHPEATTFHGVLHLTLSDCLTTNRQRGTSLPAVLNRLRGHRAASRRASTTGFGARLAMCHAVRVAFLPAPITDLRAQFAQLLGERAVARDRVAAEPTNRRALDAARRTGALALLAGHMRETVPAFGRALVACVDAGLFVPSQMFTHDVASIVEIVREFLCPYCFLEFLMMAKTRNTISKTPTIGHTPYPPIMPDP